MMPYCKTTKCFEPKNISKIDQNSQDKCCESNFILDYDEKERKWEF